MRSPRAATQVKLVYEFIRRGGEISGGRRDAYVESGISSALNAPSSSSDSSSESFPRAAIGRTGEIRVFPAILRDGGGLATKESPIGAAAGAELGLGSFFGTLVLILTEGCRVDFRAGRGGTLELVVSSCGRGGIGGPGRLLAFDTSSGRSVGALAKNGIGEGWRGVDRGCKAVELDAVLAPGIGTARGLTGGGGGGLR